MKVEEKNGQASMKKASEPEDIITNVGKSGSVVIMDVKEADHVKIMQRKLKNKRISPTITTTLRRSNGKKHWPTIQ